MVACMGWESYPRHAAIWPSIPVSGQSQAWIGPTAITVDRSRRQICVSGARQKARCACALNGGEFAA